MKGWRLLLATACIIGVAACGDDDDNGPAGPSNQPLVFSAQLSAANEVPPVSNAESQATGDATVTVTPTRDSSNTITGGTIVMAFTVRNLTPASTITLAHIHTGAAGANGGVLVNTGLSAATGIPTPQGSASYQSQPITVDGTVLNNIVSNPAGFYFNVHTALNPGGVVRGQLRAQ